MSGNIEYLITTMNAGELQKIENTNSFSGNVSREFKSFLSDRCVRAEIRELTNKKHNCLHIQLVLSEAYYFSVNLIPALMRKIASFYDFDWGFVDEVNFALVKNMSSINGVVNIDVYNISNKTTQRKA